MCDFVCVHCIIEMAIRCSDCGSYNFWLLGNIHLHFHAGLLVWGGGGGGERERRG